MGAAPVFFSSLLLLLSLSIAHPAKPDFPRSGNDDADHLRRLPVGKPLRFSADATFKIALFADLHYGENAWTDWGPAQDDHSDRVMSVVLDAENPGDDVDDDMHFSHSQIVWDGIDERNFVIYLGDVITANNLPIANATSYWDRALSSVRSRGIPWSTVFGNHDDAPFEWPSEWFSATGIPNVICPSAEFSFTDSTNCSFEGTTRVQLISTEINNNWLSYTMSGPKSLWPSVSNYMLQVFSSKDPNAPVVYFYFLDSGGGSYPEVVSNAQAQWLLRQLQEVNPNARIPEVIFWHIPSTAYKKIAPKPFFKIRKPCVGSINKERVAPQEAEWGVMDILFDRPSVKSVFAGHNHGLDWCCPCKHIWLCFARHTGYGGYGNWPRGSRIVTLTEQPFSINTWIRMEDGTEHSHVVLSN